MYALHPQRDDFLRRVLDLPPDWMTPFNAVLFRFIHPQFSAAEEIISGEGGHWASGRWNLKGAMRVAYTATEPETALAECLAHARYYNLPLSTALPRVLVSLVLRATSVLDLRDANLRRVLRIALDEMTARDLRKEFVRLVRQNGKTAVFITHQISEAMEIGDRVLVCHRPARIAFEARMDREAPAGAREAIQEKVMEVLSLETPAGG